MKVQVYADLVPDSTSPGAARRFVADTLRQAGLGWACEIVTLLVSELVTNAVIHAGTTVRLHVTVEGGQLRIAVGDDAPAAATRRFFAPDASTGRGLVLVDALTDDWGCDPTPEGKITWFSLDLARLGAIAPA